MFPAVIGSLVHLSANLNTTGSSMQQRQVLFHIVQSYGWGEPYIFAPASQNPKLNPEAVHNLSNSEHTECPKAWSFP